MLHERFDLQKWVRIFPLAKLRTESRDFVLERQRQLPEEYPNDAAVEKHIRLMSPGGCFIVGPKGLAITEQLRAESLEHLPEAPTGIDVDVFVWAMGEPEKRAVTKVGGLPYWPADATWPVDDRGDLIRFVAQLSFADSRDIFPELPGDVLLVFGDNDAVCFEPKRLVFRWMPLTILPLVDRVPETDPEETITPFFGIVHRSQDWKGDFDLLDAQYQRAWRIAVLEGTKIGGVPACIQETSALDGRFLGAIGSISVAPDQLYPFINVQEPFGWNQDHNLMIGDMGSLFLILRDDGSVTADSQCY